MIELEQRDPNEACIPYYNTNPFELVMYSGEAKVKLGSSLRNVGADK